MNFSISLKNRLALSYAVFIGLALIILTALINFFTGVFFTALVKDNIAERSREIVAAMEGRYNPFTRSFDAPAVEAMGMYFVHEGYIVTVEDADKNQVWNARSCDMRQCMDVINNISARMEKSFRVYGAMQTRVFPLNFAGRPTGSVTIETYGPYFYSEAETRFINNINRLLLISGCILVLLSTGISAALSRAIVRPVLNAGEAARRIAKKYARDSDGEEDAPLKINDHYKTRELAELSRSINTLAEELEEAQRRQKQLSSDIAHELRTPLTCLQGNIEAMLDGVYAPDREHLESCHEETIRLASLVQDLNTLTDLEWENISLNKTRFDLARLLRVTAEQFGPAAGEKGIALELKLVEAPVSADWDRLKQVFINILSNAVKYTDRGTITISINREEGSPPFAWRVTIADTGIGIPENDLPRIFERLYRGDKSRSRGTGGAGIGLAIAAAIVRAHKGRICAESKGGGSVFHIWLGEGVD